MVAFEVFYQKQTKENLNFWFHVEREDKGFMTNQEEIIGRLPQRYTGNPSRIRRISSP